MSIAFAEVADELLHPIFLVLDSFEAYLDAQLAPPDFLPWLATWVAIEVEERNGVLQSRRAIASASDDHRLRGTSKAISDTVRTVLGAEIELIEPDLTQSIPTGEAPIVHVRVLSVNVDRAALSRLLRQVIPAHLHVRIDSGS